ncbi:MAG: hypothetical protein PHT35_05160 [Bacteroidales bacterium]|nr:hypothetical protein [Bacteroidales bacterium]MDD3521711.1 hypothetical protein [Bacteroidales bacterium]MDD4030992.1 hypothetical protein [Bacteroidales bacterium]MDD4435733.1 hypothetical protein [Bacteroidales bacterium]
MKNQKFAGFLNDVKQHEAASGLHEAASGLHEAASGKHEAARDFIPWSMI